MKKFELSAETILKVLEKYPPIIEVVLPEETDDETMAKATEHLREKYPTAAFCAFRASEGYRFNMQSVFGATDLNMEQLLEKIKDNG